MKFSNLDREAVVRKLKSNLFDVLVIGGGITGAGIALDATMRGMKTALVEMQDFAAGTSSRSTKLVHGGLRYLKQFEVKMVAEVGKERAIVYENGPHVTTPEWMLLPTHKGGSFGKFSTSIGLKLYDFLAGVKNSERRMILTAGQTLKKEPLLKKEQLKGGGYYVEYRTDDARLTIEVIKKAVERGATALNYSKVKALVYRNGIVCGVLVEDLLTGEIYEIHAKKVVNATGPWIDRIREFDRSKVGKTLTLSKGVHIVIDQSRFPLKQAIYFDTPDDRMVFAIPRAGKTYVGTTDTFYDEDPINPGMTEADRSYLLEAIRYMFPNVAISEKDIESSWAGVRPLIHKEGKSPSEISRKDEVWESDSGLLTIAGGKLTGYRKMAETITDLLAKKFLEEEHCLYSSCQTRNLPISGGDVGGSAGFERFVNSQLTKGTEVGLSMDEASQLATMYGSNVLTIFDLIKNHRDDLSKSRLPIVLFAKLIYAIEYEMIASPADFFHRRTGDLLFNIDLVRDWKNEVIHYMAHQFKWTDEQTSLFTLQLEEVLTATTIPST